MRQIATSTLSNQDIHAALLAYTYTADADRGVFFRLFIDQIAGNGNYVAYVTIQRLGSGSFYQVVPITTAAVASGVTAAALTTITIPVKNTDVVKVYILGLAGDTTTPDVITEIWESSYLRPATPGRTLVVDAAGLADANAVSVGPTGAGTAQTAHDVGLTISHFPNGLIEVVP